MPVVPRSFRVVVLAAALAPTAGAQHSMDGALGAYPMTRESSGTSWQPESTPMMGRHLMKGPWMLMVLGTAQLVYDRQGGARGADDVFAPSMGMLMAQRPLGRGTLGLRAMLSLDPLGVGTRGYPLLLQTGETADGVRPLVDRQHPHDLLMELAASYSRALGERTSLFAYLGYPGEPALGPPTFMHRLSGSALIEAPILHHWLDSTHVAFGVATLGLRHGGFRLEGSSFTGREPDQRRWNWDRPRFDSYSARASFNPTANWALQVSAGHLKSPEQLEPGVDVDRLTASASYNRPGTGSNWQTTLAWGRNRKEGRDLDGLLLESAWGRRLDTFFARGEIGRKDELVADEPAAAFWVEKLSAGYRRDLRSSGPVRLGIGGLVSVYGLPEALRARYGSAPVSFMLFVSGMTD